VLDVHYDNFLWQQFQQCIGVSYACVFHVNCPPLLHRSTLSQCPRRWPCQLCLQVSVGMTGGLTLWLHTRWLLFSNSLPLSVLRPLAPQSGQTADLLFWPTRVLPMHPCGVGMPLSRDWRCLWKWGFAIAHLLPATALPPSMLSCVWGEQCRQIPQSLTLPPLSQPWQLSLRRAQWFADPAWQGQQHLRRNC
jgi:hypothetical protein